MDGKAKEELYLPPEETELPTPTEKSSFFEQFKVQLRRALIVANRNRYSKFVDTCITLIALIVISFLDGATDPTNGDDPDLDYVEATRPNENTAEQYLRNLFKYAIVPIWAFPQKVGIIISILI